MNILHEWARAWAIPAPALADLQARLGLGAPLDLPDLGGMSEAAVMSRVRLEAARQGMYLWRNNVGAGYTEDGSFMRWGLANDSKQLNQRIKSGDLIGIKRRVITQADVGHCIGQFVSREVKAEGWKYAGTDREVAQLNWCNLVNSAGGDAKFITDARLL